MAYSQNTSVASMIAATLQGVPNKNIDPRLWNELLRIQGSLKGMAAIVDQIQAAPAKVTGPITNYQGQGFAVALQDKNQVDAVAGEAIDAQNVVYFTNSGGRLTAFKAIQGTTIDAFSVNAVAAGAIGTFILKGLVVYSRSLALDWAKDGIYGQSYSYGRPNQQGRLCLYNQSNSNTTHAGLLAWCGTYQDNYVSPCKQYAGTVLGSASSDGIIQSGSSTINLHGNTFTDSIRDAIVYFNPAHTLL